MPTATNPFAPLTLATRLGVLAGKAAACANDPEAFRRAIRRIEIEAAAFRGQPAGAQR